VTTGPYAAAVAPAPTFRRPPLGWFVLLDGGLATLAVLATRPRRYDAAAARVPLPPRAQLKALLAAALAVHGAEAAVAHRLARRHGLPAGRWAGQTLVVGFPSLRALRRTAAEG